MRESEIYHVGPQIDFGDIEYVAENMRELEKRDFRRHYDSVLQGLIASVIASGKTVRVVKRIGSDRPLAIYGIGDLDGYQPWLALTKECTAHPVTVTKCCRDWVRTVAPKYPGMWNLVPCEDDPAVRLLEAIGFDVDVEKIVQQGDGDYYRFSYGGA